MNIPNISPPPPHQNQAHQNCQVFYTYQVFLCDLFTKFLHLPSFCVRTPSNNPSPQITDQSQQQKHCNKKWNVFKVNNKETRTTSTVSLLLNISFTLRIPLLLLITLSLTLRILVPLLLILNMFHILQDVQYAEIQVL